MHNCYFIKFIGFLVHSAFFCVVFLTATQISFADLLQEFRRPKLLLRIFLVTSLAVPLITAGIVKALNVPMLLGGIMLLGSVTPGSPLALMGTKSKKGNIPLASFIMIFLIVIMPVMAPCWLWIFSHWFGLHHLQISPAKLFIAVAKLTLIPIFIGILLNLLLPKITKILRKILDIYSKTAIFIIIGVFIIPGLKMLITFSPIEWIAIIVVITLILVIGYYSGGETRPEHISIAVAATKSNLTALMAIAHVSYPHIHIFDVLLAYMIVCGLTTAIWYMLFKRQLAHNNETLQ